MKLCTFEFYKSKQGNKCFYCKETLYASTATRDHYIPKSLGGKGHIKLSCATCNKIKANIPPQVYLEKIRCLFFTYYTRELQRI